MSGRRAPLIAGAAVAAIAILAILFLVLPKMRSVGEAQDDLRVAEEETQSLQAQVAALQEAQEAAPQTEQEIAQIDDQVPPVVDLPVLFQQLQAAADRAAVDFFSFTPGTPATDPTGAFSVLSSQITVNGGYFSVDEFLFLLETLPRAAKVISITISPSAGDTTTTGTGTGMATTSPAPSASSSTLQLQATVEFYTTDTSAGPGSEPGPSNGTTGTTGAVGTTGVTATTGAAGPTP